MGYTHGNSSSRLPPTPTPTPRMMYVGVGREGLDVEKGGHHKAGAWYLRTDEGTLHGGLDGVEQTPIEPLSVRLWLETGLGFE